ncbi:MAG TPA: hypothetical protein VGA77_06620 [Propylenella sp.]
MKIVIYQHALQHAGTWLAAMEAGMIRHGHRPVIDMWSGRVHQCDVAVVWGIGAYRAVLAAGRTVVIERGYMGDRFAWTSAGWDGLNGRAAFRNQDVDGARWDRHFAPLMQPWRGVVGGQHVLVAGQVAGDSAVRGVDLPAWYRACAAAYPGAQIRPHPRTMGIDNGVRRSGLPIVDGTLAGALTAARLVVTYNSNLGTDAMLAGVPVVACDEGSMVWPVAGHALGGPVVEPTAAQRVAWAHRMAWCQWTIEEMAAGECWAHLRSGIDERH